MTLQDVLDFGDPTDQDASDLDATGPAMTQLAPRLLRTELSAGAWVDLAPGWLQGVDEVFADLLREVAWRADRRQMYDTVVDVPRLTRFYGATEPWPHPFLHEIRTALNAHYQPTLGEPLVTAGMCLYRDGRDSVAWHGDRIGRARHTDTIVAIVSFGATRTLTLRPSGGGKSLRFVTGHGDLLVMGGSCQRTWEHAIPKTSEPVGPRISVQYRPAGVR